MLEDFFSAYLDYTLETESPTIMHRWAAITSLGAYLGRQFYFQHGHFTVYPNMYCMFIGSPGTRKSTAIKLVKSIIQRAGYTSIAADKSTKEKFILDLAGEDTGESTVDDILDRNLFGGEDDVREMFIMADEFNDFFGNGNLEFISLLGNLWDFSGVYKNRIKNGKSVAISNPTISILGGNTPTGMNLAFPPEVLGQGFFSRLLLIYGEPSGKQFPFPPTPSDTATATLVECLREIKQTVFGSAELVAGAKELLEQIYSAPFSIDDARFESYRTRRFTHLLKLCLVVAANRASTRITENDVVYANTILTHAEQFMPRALGEFGRAKNSDVSHKVYQVICDASGPIKLKDIWKQVHADLEKLPQLQEIIQNLAEADKIQAIPQLGAFLPKRRLLLEANPSFVDYSLLTEAERQMKK